MPLPLYALQGLAAAQSLAPAVATTAAAKLVVGRMEGVAKEFQKGSKSLKELVNVSEGKPAEPEKELQLDHPAEVWAHRGSPKWFVGKSVKVDFRAPSGVHEYVWVQVVASSPTMIGRLLSTPEFLPAKMGATVTFKVKQIVDVQMPRGRTMSGGRRT